MSIAASLLDGPAGAIAAAVRTREVSVAELVEASLARIVATDPALAAFAAVSADRARQRAEEIDNELLDRKATAALLPLVGVPFAVSNAIDVAGLGTHAGAAIERDRAPARRDARIVARLEEAGAVLVGATSLDAFGCGSTSESSIGGPVRNPHDLARTPGGASGGAAAVVSAAHVPVSLGLDASGGMRVPASLCGVFALKPTYGRIPRSGTYPYAPSLDHIAACARHPADLALAYDAIQGHDARDPACVARPVEPTRAGISGRVESLRIGVLADALDVPLRAEARTALGRVAQALDARREAAWPHFAEANAAASLVVLAESASLHLESLRRRAADYPPRTRDRLLAGAMLPAAWTEQAQRVRRACALRAAELLREFDVLLAPATPCAAPHLGRATLELGGSTLPIDAALDSLAQPLSFIGLPVAVVPVWDCHPTLPIGVQVIGAPWREDVVLRVAQHLQASGIARAPVATVTEAALRAAISGANTGPNSGPSSGATSGS